MLALRIHSLDPAHNLALEECLFDSLKPGEPGWFLVWRNGPSIIVGRHQNTLEEIDEAFIRESGIPVVRRGTGGGAVYHDEGNLNFSFLTTISRNEKAEFAPFMRLMVDALGDLGIQAELSSRNDITVAGRKISGSAQRRSGQKLLHHGTMLVDLNMSVLGRALTATRTSTVPRGLPPIGAEWPICVNSWIPRLIRDTCLRMSRTPWYAAAPGRGDSSA